MHIKLTVFIAVVAIFVILLLREVVLWYFKINQRIKEQKLTNEYLKEQVSLMRKLMTLEIEKRKERIVLQKARGEYQGEHFSSEELKDKDTEDK